MSVSSYLSLSDYLNFCGFTTTYEPIKLFNQKYKGKPLAVSGLVVHNGAKTIRLQLPEQHSEQQPPDQRALHPDIVINIQSESDKDPYLADLLSPDHFARRLVIRATNFGLNLPSLYLFIYLIF